MVKRVFLRGEDSYEPYFLIVSILLFVLVSLFMFGNPIKSDKLEVSYCGDATLEGFCSKNEPYYCSNGILVTNSKLCGCPANFSANEDSCFSDFQTDSSDRTLKYVIRGDEKEINFTIYGEMVDYLSTVSREIVYTNGKTPSREDFKFKKIIIYFIQKFMDAF